MADFRRWYPTLLACLIGLSLLVTPPCRAQSPDGEAKSLFKQGNALFAKGDYAAALERFERAFTLRPNPKILINIGTTNHKLKRLPAAALAYERFLQQVDPGASAKRVAAVRQRLDQLRRGLASLTVIYGPSGATVRVGQRAVGTTPLKNRVYLNPGTHELVVEKAGYKAFSETMTLSAGEHRRLESTLQVDGDYKPPVPATQPAPPPSSQPAAATHPAARLPPPAPPPARTGPTPFYKKWWFWTVVGVAVVGSTTAGIVATQTGGDARLPEGELGVFGAD